ncbi:hypothetical protein Taro_014743 [Colocasia esculenta]|uniref:Uncharacterized protein n=1 Tax=Colocasia esculenta TaxID=4460 RepID=A0A843U9T5_COLES|nr:hypothetical protein [Colocasia esculenta]
MVREQQGQVAPRPWILDAVPILVVVLIAAHVLALVGIRLPMLKNPNPPFPALFFEICECSVVESLFIGSTGWRLRSNHACKPVFNCNGKLWTYGRCEMNGCHVSIVLHIDALVLEIFIKHIQTMSNPVTIHWNFWRGNILNISILSILLIFFFIVIPITVMRVLLFNFLRSFAKTAKHFIFTTFVPHKGFGASAERHLNHAESCEATPEATEAIALALLADVRHRNSTLPRFISEAIASSDFDNVYACMVKLQSSLRRRQ